MPRRACLARSPLAIPAEPLLVYLGVNPFTIKLSDHGAPSLFLFTSNYGAEAPLPFPSHKAFKPASTSPAGSR